MKMIDLRSDTLSLPTPAMRKAIYEAEVGDDCFGDDPTVRVLEEYCASFFGKESALFTCGGTMSNQIALKSLTNPGDEVILDACYHINFFESAATSTFSGVNFNLLYTQSGIFSGSDITKINNTKARWNANYALPKVIVIENTISCKGGLVFPLGHMQTIYAFAQSLKASVYMDGARIINAAIASGVKPADYASQVDCLAMCFAKGLGAPIGSILVGDQAFIQKARKYRKWFGGDMHQSGMAAAAALYAMKNHTHKIQEDHDNMCLLYNALKDLDGIECIYGGTNMLFINLQQLSINATALVEVLEREGIKALAWTHNEVRFMTCLNISREEMLKACKIIRDAILDISSTSRTSSIGTKVVNFA